MMVPLGQKYQFKYKRRRLLVWEHNRFNVAGRGPGWDLFTEWDGTSWTETADINTAEV